MLRLLEILMEPWRSILTVFILALFPVDSILTILWWWVGWKVILPEIGVISTPNFSKLVQWCLLQVLLDLDRCVGNTLQQWRRLPYRIPWRWFSPFLCWQGKYNICADTWYILHINFIFYICSTLFFSTSYRGIMAQLYNNIDIHCLWHLTRVLGLL